MNRGVMHTILPTGQITVHLLINASHGPLISLLDFFYLVETCIWLVFCAFLTVHTMSDTSITQLLCKRVSDVTVKVLQ